MKIIVCGAGQVGWQIARHLSSEDNEITVVDQNADLIRRISDTLEVNGVVGFASYPEILERAGASDADMVIAATYSDEINMVTCQVAHSVFGVRRKIARLRSQSYLSTMYSDLYRRDHLPIDVIISPETEVAKAALQRVQSPSTFDTEIFFNGQAQIMGLNIDEACPVINTPLRQLSELFSTLRTIVVGIRRDETLFAPEPNDQIFPGDQIYVFTHIADVARTLEVFGKSHTNQERIVIVGGGNVGLAVARALEKRPDRMRVKMIEKNRANAERAADQLERTIVLHGDGLDQTLLEEANIRDADTILTLTDDDKTNILACVRAKEMGARQAVSLVNDPGLLSLMDPLSVDAYINPRATTVSSILRHIRHGRVRNVYSIGDSEAEMIEAEVLGSSQLAGFEIGNIEFPEGVLIGGILRGAQYLKPAADLRIEEGDIVAIFSITADVQQTERLLQVSVNYF